MAYKDRCKKLSKRVKAMKHQGDDHWSWAVFIDGIPFVTGLAKNEVPYYKGRAIDRLLLSSDESKNS